MFRRLPSSTAPSVSDRASRQLLPSPWQPRRAGDRSGDKVAVERAPRLRCVFGPGARGSAGRSGRAATSAPARWPLPWTRLRICSARCSGCARRRGWLQESREPAGRTRELRDILSPMRSCRSTREGESGRAEASNRLSRLGNGRRRRTAVGLPRDVFTRGSHASGGDAGGLLQSQQSSEPAVIFSRSNRSA